MFQVQSQSQLIDVSLSQVNSPKSYEKIQGYQNIRINQGIECEENYKQKKLNVSNFKDKVSSLHSSRNQSPNLNQQFLKNDYKEQIGKISEWEMVLKQQKEQKQEFRSFQNQIQDIEKMQYNLLMPKLNMQCLDSIMKDTNQQNTFQGNQQVSTNSNIPEGEKDENEQYIQQLFGSQELRNKDLNHFIKVYEEKAKKTDNIKQLEANQQLMINFFQQKINIQLKKLQSIEKNKTNRNLMEEFENQNQNNGKQIQKEENKKKSIILNQEDLIQKDKLYEIIKINTEKFIEDVMGKFKVLGDPSMHSLKVINYDRIFFNILENNMINLNNQLNDQLNQLKKNRNHTEQIEQFLINNLNEVENDFERKKIQNEKLREDIAEQNKVIKNLKEEKQRIQYEYQHKSLIISEEIKNYDEFKKRGELHKLTYLSSKRNNSQTPLTKYDLKKEVILLQEENTQQIQNITIQVNEKTAKCDKDLKTYLTGLTEITFLKQKKKSFQFLLQELYLKIFQEQKEDHQKGLLWLIKSLWNISHKNPIQSDKINSRIESHGIDNHSVIFLSLYSEIQMQLNKTINDLEQKNRIKIRSSKFKGNQYTLKEILQSREIGVNYDQIKQKIKDKIKMVIKDQQNESNQNINISHMIQGEKNQENSDEQTITQLQNRLDELKINEFKRIFSKYCKGKHINEQHVFYQIRNYLLPILGVQETQSWMQLFEKQIEEYNEKINMHKTFNFSESRKKSQSKSSSLYQNIYQQIISNNKNNNLREKNTASVYQENSNNLQSFSQENINSNNNTLNFQNSSSSNNFFNQSNSNFINLNSNNLQQTNNLQLINLPGIQKQANSIIIDQKQILKFQTINSKFFQQKNQQSNSVNPLLFGIFKRKVLQNTENSKLIQNNNINNVENFQSQENSLHQRNLSTGNKSSFRIKINNENNNGFKTFREKQVKFDI